MTREKVTQPAPPASLKKKTGLMVRAYCLTFRA